MSPSRPASCSLSGGNDASELKRDLRVRLPSLRRRHGFDLQSRGTWKRNVFIEPGVSFSAFTGFATASLGECRMCAAGDLVFSCAEQEAPPSAMNRESPF